MKSSVRLLRWLPVALIGAGLAAYVVRRGDVVARARRGWATQLYRLIYLLRLTPWDTPAPAAEVVARVEGPGALPPGRALDIGCGTGRNAIYLARHGWRAIGVDAVGRALDAARRNARAAGASPRFVLGDVTRLQELGIGGHYDLLLDFGCFHTIPTDRRDAYAEAVTAVAAPGATMLLFGFANPWFAPIESGIREGEVRSRFRSWDVVSARAFTRDETRAQFGGASSATDVAARTFRPWQYELRRRS